MHLMAVALRWCQSFDCVRTLYSVTWIEYTVLTHVIIIIAYCIFCMRKNPGLTRTFYPTNGVLLSFSSSYQNSLPSLFPLEIPEIRSAEYKLPIIREICICMFN